MAGNQRTVDEMTRAGDYVMRPPGPLQDGLRQLIAELPLNCRMAEVGCYTGESTRMFAEKVLHITAVDAWPYRAVEAKFDERMKGVTNITKWRCPSMIAASRIPRGSLDFVYIDAWHDYPYVFQDIAAWLPTLRDDGTIAGHDFYSPDDPHHPGVRRAVLELLGGVRRYADFSWSKTVRALPRLWREQFTRFMPHGLPLPWNADTNVFEIQLPYCDDAASEPVTPDDASFPPT